ncbi:MAG: SPOR domain-containing protein [Desulfomonile tiedjei]|nr:SPOR domain-containing protein [Desulfomonile tiedjei]
MGVRDFFKRRPRFTVTRPVGKLISGDAQPPKNGILTLLVVASVALMAVLAVLNVRLIQDPSIAGKAFGPLVPARPERRPACAPNPLGSTSGPNACPAPPEVTFYRNLVAQDERDAGKNKPAPDQGSDGTVGSGTQKRADGAAAVKSPSNREEPGPNYGAPAKTSSQEVAVAEADLPGPESGDKSYIVQVGAFTQPRIAEQWAAKWKSRGYDVLLKPVARPKSGVTYRLYLGKFSSQKEADALVKRLKAKEGISAFTLLVHR